MRTRSKVKLQDVSIRVYDIMEEIPKQLETGLEADRFKTVQTWQNISCSPLQKMEWGSVDTIGVIFTVHGAKVHGTVST